MTNETKNNVINKVISWGLGGVLLIGGALTMIFHKNLDLEFPTFLWVGLSIMVVGIIVWLIPVILNHQKELIKLKHEMELETKAVDKEEPQQVKQKLIKYRNEK